MDHHPFSPSQLYRLYLCPGSHRMAEGLPDTLSEYAEEGTRLHGLVASYLNGNEPAEASEEDMILLQKCLDFVEAKIAPDDRVIIARFHSMIAKTAQFPRQLIIPADDHSGIASSSEVF